MTDFKNTSENSRDIFELARKFELEELEERVEFGKWSQETIFDPPVDVDPNAI
ncbi:hypothetical protein ABWH96_04440 [Marivirga tractuosa]|uniref:hypothetical protein n=1 Tax=Marivirga tractuosa TaxID=1006 RepID=UPI0035D00D32